MTKSERKRWRIPAGFLLVMVFVLVWGLFACQSKSPVGQEDVGSVLSASQTIDATRSVSGTQGTITPPVGIGQKRSNPNEIRQWAINASASSEFSSKEWSARQMIGEPDTPRCGDYQTAWASAGSDSVETIVLTYTLSVKVSKIIIYETFNPNQVVQVTLIGRKGEKEDVYFQPPKAIDQPCPYPLVIHVQNPKFKARVVQIRLDQSVLGLGWNEIDAVELTGTIK